MSQDPRTKPDDDQTEPGAPGSLPPAGPHAREDLIDNEKTPGTGSLPDPQGSDADVGSE